MVLYENTGIKKRGFMISQTVIEEIKRRLIKVYDPAKIYLFGSYAWGVPHEESDLDIFIIVDHSNERAIKRSFLGYKALWGLGIAKDIIVYTNDEFEASSQKEASLPYKVKHYGKAIYVRAKSYHPHSLCNIFSVSR
jgi:predicted nucleotidyltransferase